MWGGGGGRLERFSFSIHMLLAVYVIDDDIISTTVYLSLIRTKY